MGDLTAQLRIDDQNPHGSSFNDDRVSSLRVSAHSIFRKGAQEATTYILALLG